MRGKDLLEGMGFVDQRLVNEAAESELTRPAKRPKWQRWSAAAACAVLVLTAALAGLPGTWTGDDPAATGSPGVEDGPAAETDTGSDVSKLFANPIGGQPEKTVQEIALGVEDRRTMTYDELLAYFGYGELPLEAAMPSLTVQTPEEFTWGVYETAERGVYYDHNSICLKSGDGAQEIWLTLSKCRTEVGAVLDLTLETLGFHRINGRWLALFCWTNADGDACVYVEFMQHGVAHTVLFKNLSYEEIGGCLAALVEEKEDKDENSSLLGEIVALDVNTNRITLRTDDGRDYPYLAVTLPETVSAAEYALGQRLEIVYRWEPATLCHVWPQQLVSICPVSE